MAIRGYGWTRGQVGAEMNGFVDPDNEIAVAWNDATRTVTLTPVGASFRFYVNGTLFTKSAAESFTIADTTGNHYVYYNTSGVLTEMTTFTDDLIMVYAFAVSMYWNATTAKAVPDVMKEFHLANTPNTVHLYQHSTHATMYDTHIGGLLPTVSVGGDGSLLADIQIACSAGAIWDDDVRHSIPARLAADNIPVLYKTGAGDGVWTYDETSSAAVRTTGTGRAAWNQLTGGSWQLTEVANGRTVLAHLFAIPGVTKKWMCLMGVAEYTTLADARANASQEIITITGIPLAEHKDIASFVVLTADAHTNAVKSRFLQIDTGVDFIDWRSNEVGLSETGDVYGPASSVSGRIATFLGTTGKTIQDSGKLTTDFAPSANPTFTGVVTLDVGATFNADSGTATSTAGAATLNKMAGKITSEALTTAAGADYVLTLTNSTVAAADMVFASLANGTNTGGTPTVEVVTTGAGSVVFTVHNHSTLNAFNGTVVVSYVVVKA